MFANTILFTSINRLSGVVMIRSILVPLDGSPFSEHALPLAAKIGHCARARLHIARVHQYIPPPYGAGISFVDPVDKALKEREQTYLQEMARRLSVISSCPVSSEFLD